MPTILNKERFHELLPIVQHHRTNGWQAVIESVENMPDDLEQEMHQVMAVGGLDTPETFLELASNPEWTAAFQEMAMFGYCEMLWRMMQVDAKSQAASGN